MKIHSMSQIREAIQNSYLVEGLDSDSKLSAVLTALYFKALTSPPKEYDVSFHREEDGGWYIEFPKWPGRKSDLAMVAGADKMLEAIGHGQPKVHTIIRKSNEPLPDQMLDEGWIELSLQRCSLQGGGTYLTRGIPNFVVKFPWRDTTQPRTVWLCPVTLFVFGSYPRYFYGKVIE